MDKLLSIDNNSIHNQKISPISLPNNILTPSSNHNNNVKSDCTIKSGLSLDAGALQKQAMSGTPQNMKYANVNTGEPVTSNGVLQTDPFANRNQKYLNETEINC